MAQIAITKLIDGPRNAVFHVAIAGDGSGDLSDEVIIDPATSFDPALPGKPVMTIDRLQYDLSGFNGVLSFDYLTSNIQVWSMSANCYSDADMCQWGGIKDRAPMGGQGTLKLSTSGLASGDRGTLIVKVRKD